jgi:hypothetical protein
MDNHCMHVTTKTNRMDVLLQLSTNPHGYLLASEEIEPCHACN